MTANQQTKKNTKSVYLTIPFIVWFFTFLIIIFIRHNDIISHQKVTFLGFNSDSAMSEDGVTKSEHIKETTKEATKETAKPLFKAQQVSIEKDAPSVHAATATQIDDNHIEAMWFAGSREGAKDVAIHANRYSLDTQTWSTPRVVLTKQMVEEQSNTYIKKLGNPILFRNTDGIVHLFVVGVSVGGWAGSKIYHFQAKADIKDTDGNEKYEFKKVLPLSPFMNVSHLVRGVPVGLSDGGFYLPVYHEMAEKFNLLLRFNAEGELISRIRPNQLKQVLQPSLTPISAEGCLTVMRNSPKPHTSLWVQQCHKTANTWQPPIKTNINNDNNSLNVIWFNQQALFIHNKKRDNHERYYLHLSSYDVLTNQTKFIAVLDTAEKDGGGEVSYPTTLVIGDEVHVLYTYQRDIIKHIIFNQAWMNTHGL